MNSIYGWFCAFHDQKFAWQDAVRLCIKFLPRSSNPIMLLSHWLTFFGPKSSISLLQDLRMYLNLFGAWNWKSLWISSWTRPYFSMLICHIHWKKTEALDGDRPMFETRIIFLCTQGSRTPSSINSSGIILTSPLPKPQMTSSTVSQVVC